MSSARRPPRSLRSGIALAVLMGPTDAPTRAQVQVMGFGTAPTENTSMALLEGQASTIAVPDPEAAKPGVMVASGPRETEPGIVNHLPLPTVAPVESPSYAIAVDKLTADQTQLTAGGCYSMCGKASGAPRAAHH